MRHRTVAFAVLLGCSFAHSRPATANIDIDVDLAAPFSKQDLREAVQLRRTVAGDTRVVVRVAKLGHNRFVVSVGDRAQLVELSSDDRTSSARVVALVVVSLLMDDRSPTELPPENEAPSRVTAAGAVAPPGQLSLRVSGALTRDDNGYEFPILGGSGVYSLSSHASLVASAGIGRYDGYGETRSLIVPIRVGVEGRAGAAGVEIGGQLLSYRESSCGTAEWGAAESVYGAAKVILPVGGSKRLVGEVGGYLALANGTTVCNSALNYTGYGGWVGFGVEWAP